MIFIVGCNFDSEPIISEQDQAEQQDSMPIDLTENNPFVISCEQLNEHLNAQKAGFVVFDVRKASEYEDGHIEGAFHVWRNDFNEERNGLSSFIGSKEKIQNLLSSHGVKKEDTLVLYDDCGGVNASRFWFVLNEHGWSNVKILDGGIVKWKQSNFNTTTNASVLAEASGFVFDNSFTISSLNIDLNQLLKVKSSIKLLDSRTLEEFRGDTIKRGAKRGGRIPGALRFDYSELSKVAPNEDHTFRKSDVVLSKLNAIGVSSSDSIVVYCQSGARSALLAFYFTRVLGFENVQNYDGSWIEWSHQDELPIATGDPSES